MTENVDVGVSYDDERAIGDMLFLQIMFLNADFWY